MRTARVFVYGTLQEGSWNYRPWMWLDRGEKGTVPGAIYDHGYPVAKFDEEGTIHGTFYTADLDSREWEMVERMERGAGYDLIKVNGTDLCGYQWSALAFHYVGKPRGPRIESGDFLAYDAEKSAETA